MTQSGKWSILLWLLIPLALLAILFGPILTTHQTLYYRDLMSFHFPLWAVSAEYVAQGEFPLWNPRVNFGQNSGGNPDYLLWYPPAWLRFLMPPLPAMNLFVLFHLLTGGVLFYALLRQWSLGPTASFWGAGIYLFSGVTLSLTCLLNLVPYILLAPLFLWSLERLLQCLKGPRIAPVAFSAALLVTVFEPFLIFGLLLVAAGRCGWAWIGSASADRRRRLAGSLVLALLLAVMLAGPVLAEGIRLLEQTAGRPPDPGTPSRYVQHPWLTLGLWVPNPLEFSHADLAAAGGQQVLPGQYPLLFSVFISFGGLLFGWRPFADPQHRRLAVALAGTALLFLLLSFGGHIPWLAGALQSLPLVGTGRYPEKFMFFTSGALVVLLALGMDTLHRPANERLRPAFRYILTLLLPLLAVALAALAPDLSLRPLATISLGIAAAVAVLLLLRPAALPLPGWRIHLIGVLLLVELAAANRHTVPRMDAARFLEPAPLFAALAREEPDLDLFRVAVEPPPEPVYYQRTDTEWKMLVTKFSGHPYFGIIQGVHYAFDLFYDKLESTATAHLRQAYLAGPLPWRIGLMQRTGVKYLVSPREYHTTDLALAGVFPTGSNYLFRLYRLTATRGRYSLVQDWQVFPAADDVAGLLAAGANTVLLDRRPRFPSFSNDPLPEDAPGEITLDHSGCDRISFSIVTGKPAILVLRDTFYPGWRAWVDDGETDILRADLFFRGVAVPSGRHTVVFHYDPPAFLPLVLLSLAAALALAAGAILPRFRRRPLAGG
ncbi:MAG: hypothetical protein JXQ27_04175 [Acidobacteria bacterium]|nr:hypothetical protein [Acidobacteriota bacterium]